MDERTNSVANAVSLSRARDGLTVRSLFAYQVMLDTVGPELQVVNKKETTISLEENGTVVLTPHRGQEASSSLLPINFSGLAKVTTC
jgi:hypothetical protein